MPDQLALDHQTGIGASQVAALLNPPCHTFANASRFHVYQRALGLDHEPPKQDDHLWFGNAVEPILRDWFFRRTGLPVYKPSEKYTCAGRPHMLCHPDALTPTHTFVVEFKVAGRRNWGEWGDEGQVPQAYYVQCQHSMHVLGVPLAKLCVLIGTEFIIHDIRYDAELCNEIIVPAVDAAWKEILELRDLMETDKAKCYDRLTAIQKASEEEKGKLCRTLWPVARHREIVPVPQEWRPTLLRLREQHEYATAATQNCYELENQLKRAMTDEVYGWSAGGAGDGAEIVFRRYGRGHRVIVKDT